MNPNKDFNGQRANECFILMRFKTRCHYHDVKLTRDPVVYFKFTYTVKNWHFWQEKYNLVSLKTEEWRPVKEGEKNEAVVHHVANNLFIAPV